MTKRFDVMIDGHYPGEADRILNEHGEFVEAEDAETLAKALEIVQMYVDDWPGALGIVESALDTYYGKR